MHHKNMIFRMVLKNVLAGESSDRSPSIKFNYRKCRFISINFIGSKEQILDFVLIFNDFGDPFLQFVVIELIEEPWQWCFDVVPSLFRYKNIWAILYGLT